MKVTWRRSDSSNIWTSIQLFLFTVVAIILPSDVAATRQNRTNSMQGSLMKWLYSNYDKELIPSKPVMVKLDVLLNRVKGTIEKDSVFESVIGVFIQWEDPRMSWDPAEFDNVTLLAFDADRVWMPDVAMTNSADHPYSISKDMRFVARVTYDGTFWYIPTGTAKTWCELKLFAFPFDVQVCSIEFESWSLDNTAIQFNPLSNISTDIGFTTTQWELCGLRPNVYEFYYTISDETFSRVRFDLIVKRKSTFYVVNLIFPCATLSAIQLLVFAIPSVDSSSDRVGFGTTNLLTLVVFQTIVTQEMPKSSDAVTTLSKYVIYLIILSAIGILESVAIERILRDCETRRPADWILRLSKIFPFKYWWRQQAKSLLRRKLNKLASPENDDDVDSPSKPIPRPRPRVYESQSTELKQRIFQDPVALPADLSSNSLSTIALPNIARNRFATSSLQQQLRRRRVSRDYLDERDERAIQRQSRELWEDLASLIDVLTFALSFSLAVVLPATLFVPYMIEADHLCTNWNSFDDHQEQHMSSN